jgi:hypothetical protein
MAVALRIPVLTVIARQNLVEDTTGKGHLSQHVEGKIRHSIFVPID